MEAAQDADPRGKRDPRDFALWKGWKKESEPETAAWPSPWGPGRPGLAHRVLGDGGEVPRPRLRHPRRRRRPALPPPRERAGPVPRGRAPVRVVLDAQRLDHHRRREDVQVARQLPADPERAGAGARDRAAVLHGRGPLPLARRVLLRGARRGGRRRSAGSRASSSGRRPSSASCPMAARHARTSCEAMDDDLGTPAAVAAIHDVVQRGQQAARRWTDATALRGEPRERPAGCWTSSVCTPPTRPGGPAAGATNG